MDFIKKGKFGAYELNPKIHVDQRGYFFESFRKDLFNKKIGKFNFVQDNYSFSKQNTLRGIHLQKNKMQGKLVSVLEGHIFDVCLDLRLKSKYFGQYICLEISENLNNQFWIPPGCGHGFLVLSKYAKVLYKCTNYYSPEGEITINWNDKDLNIPWPLPKDDNLLISNKDRNGINFKDYCSEGDNK